MELYLQPPLHLPQRRQRAPGHGTGGAVLRGVHPSVHLGRQRGGWNEDLVLVLTMLLNFVLEFLYQKFVVYRNLADTNDVAKRAMEKEQEKQNKAC